MILWLALIAGTLFISIGAGIMVKSRFHRARGVALESGLSGAEIARMILRAKDVHDVDVVETSGFLSDHYHPGTKQLALSREVYHGRTAAAAGVAAHEVGHALQQHEGSLSLGLRSWLAPAAGLGSGLAPYIIIAGALLGGFQQVALGAQWGLAAYVLVAGLGLFGAFTLFTLVTVPNEYNASARAVVVLEDLNVVRSPQEMAAVRGVLSAAGLTYVAAAVSSVAWLLYWLLPLIIPRD